MEQQQNSSCSTSTAQLVGVDPSPVFIDMAREAFAGEPRASFLVGDAVATGQADACFDLVNRFPTRGVGSTSVLK